MGFFDFLHGGSSQKSEAEIYMEQRNREYAQKAAAYRKQEKMSELIEQMGLNSGLRRTNTSSRNGTKRNIVDTIANKVGSTTKQLIADITCGETQCQTNTSISKTPKYISCDSCNQDTSAYDKKESAILDIQSAKINPAIRTVVVNGNVVKGWFEVGDRVQIISKLETRDAILAKIVRQGVNAEYANRSSGNVNMIFTNIADMMIRNGDRIIKAK